MDSKNNQQKREYFEPKYVVAIELTDKQRYILFVLLGIMLLGYLAFTLQFVLTIMSIDNLYKVILSQSTINTTTAFARGLIPLIPTR
jgi:hypothetical protein